VQGNAAYKAGKLEEALALYTAAIDANKDNTVVRANRAMVLLKLNRYAEAEADCTTVLAKEPDNVKVLWRRATARRQLGKTADAVAGADGRPAMGRSG